VLVLAAALVRLDLGAVRLDPLRGTTYYPQAWNGRRIYLSPAHHEPENTGCAGYAESEGARRIAFAAKDALVALGYAVRVGSGDFIANSEDSHAFRSHVHIAIHSNAYGREDDWDCEGKDARHGGTWLMYAKPADYRLAEALFTALRPESPGVNDRLDLDLNLSGRGLWELRAIDVPAAYIETGFHTYGPDVAWLRQPDRVGAAIARGIDAYFRSLYSLGRSDSS
jgi:N-acetylmuramoyl-L-alanine amidase